MTEFARCPAFNIECQYVAEVDRLSAENERLREALERIAANVHAPCARLMTHPDMCRQAYEARAALGEKSE